jgi:hypothetical protein
MMDPLLLAASPDDCSLTFLVGAATQQFGCNQNQPAEKVKCGSQHLPDS